jgi:tRNA1Val (adenine37-N6)-methyltransferase
MARNSYFKFKQFVIQQAHCAMKVCTDAATFGAWVEIGTSKHVLDIGTGTGLLALMLAQKYPHVFIDAVEYDENAALQAQQNVMESPFSKQIRVIHTAIQDYYPDRTYDCIVSNPPFFQSDLRSPENQLKNVAHHADTLNFMDLISAVDRLLHAEGHFCVLLPTDEGAVFLQLMTEQGWQLEQNVFLQHHPEKRAFRTFMRFVRRQFAQDVYAESSLYIYEKDSITYGQAFQELMKEYYLKL